MALTINSTPPSVVLAGNGINYNISTDNAFSAAGSQPYFRIAMTANWEDISDGDTLTLAWDDQELEFIFDATPDESGLSLPVPDAYASVLEYSEALRAAFMNNYYFATLCELVETPMNSSFDIRFLQKANLSLTFTNSIPTLITVTAFQGTAQVYRDNYRVGVLIIANGDYVAAEEKFPYPSLDVDFDIADFIKHLSSSDFTMYPAANTLLFLHQSAIIPFVAKFFEKYGSPPVPYKLYADETRYALPGGIDKTMIAQFDTDETNWFEYFTANKKFLTWADDGIKLKYDDIFRLYFLLNTDHDIILKWARYTPQGYILGSWQFTLVLSPTNDKSIVEVICDPLKMMSQGTLDNIAYYDVKLYDDTDNEDISETFRIYVDNTLSSQRLQFMFANSFECAFDTVFAYGKAEHNIELDNYTLLSIDKTKQQSRSERIEKMTIRSGFLTFRQLFYWQEFIQSNKRYLIRDGRRIPVRIISTDIFMYKNQEYNFAIELQIELDDPDSYRSTIPDQAISFSDYFNSYGFSIGITASLSGHIILDADGNEMPQRSKLKFTGYGVDVSDSEAGDMTIVDISSPGFWIDITAYFDESVPQNNQLATISNLTGSIAVGDIIRITQNSVEKEATVTAVASGTITISTTNLEPEWPVTEVRVKSLDGPTASSKEFTLNSANWIEAAGVYTQTITVPHVRVISLVIVSPAGVDDTNEDNYANARIKGSANGTNQITIRASSLPTSNINVQITYLWQ